MAAAPIRKRSKQINPTYKGHGTGPVVTAWNSIGASPHISPKKTSCNLRAGPRPLKPTIFLRNQVMTRPERSPTPKPLPTAQKAGARGCEARGCEAQVLHLRITRGTSTSKRAPSPLHARMPDLLRNFRPLKPLDLKPTLNTLNRGKKKRLKKKMPYELIPKLQATECCPSLVTHACEEKNRSASSVRAMMPLIPFTRTIWLRGLATSEPWVKRLFGNVPAFWSRCQDELLLQLQDNSGTTSQLRPTSHNLRLRQEFVHSVQTCSAANLDVLKLAQQIHSGGVGLCTRWPCEVVQNRAKQMSNDER